MLRLIKFAVYGIVLALVGVAGFAYLGDLSPQRQEHSEPVSLDAQ